MGATDAGEQAELQKLCTKEGKQDYQEYIAESYTYAELLEKFPSCKPSIGSLVDYIPDIKPRLYSIASSSRLRGNDECHLCIIKNEWNATSGRNCVGLSTGWLERVDPGTEGLSMRAFVHPSAVTMPETHKTPMALVFGARNRQEYSYEAEFDAYKEEGVLPEIHLALSREQKEKIYVTHRLQQQKQLVYDLIHEKEGNLYLC